MKSSLNLILKVLCFLPILFAVAMLNYIQDPVNVFISYESRLARELISGSYVTDFKLSTEIERKLQKYYIEQRHEAPHTVVFGSSRTMALHSEVLGERSFFNHSVSGGSLEDYMAIYGFYKKNNRLPKKAIVNIDPWIFNKDNDLTYWKPIAESYEWMLSLENQSKHQVKFRLAEFVPQKVTDLFSFSYFQQTLEQLQQSGFKLKSDKAVREDPFRVTKERYNEQLTILSDGSREPDRQTREVSEEEVRANATNFVLKLGVDRYHRDFKQMDPELKQRFEWFLSLMKQDGVQVVLLLPPYHPYLSRFLQDNHFTVIGSIEDYLRQYAAVNRWEIYGSYDPLLLSLTERDFIDALHFKESVFPRIFANPVASPKK